MIITRKFLIQEIADAVARIEEFYEPYSLSAENHNPGNLLLWSGYPVQKGRVYFPDDETGWDKLELKLGGYFDKGNSLFTIFNIYDSVNKESPETYAKLVQRHLKEHGVDVGIREKLADLINAY